MEGSRRITGIWHCLAIRMLTLSIVSDLFRYKSSSYGNLEEIVSECGLTVNIPKTKLLVAGGDETDVQPIFIKEVIKAVTNFRYRTHSTLRPLQL